MNFYRRMALVCAAVPRGTVVTYGQLARLCGFPRNARQAGYALRMDLAGPAPAHRVVNARGQLSGALHFAAWDAQRAMLQEEGVSVEWDGTCWRVELERFQWIPGQEEMARLEEAFAAEEI